MEVEFTSKSPCLAKQLEAAMNINEIPDRDWKTLATTL